MVHDRRTRKVAPFGRYNGLQDLGDSWIWDDRSMTWVQAAPIHCPKAVTAKQDHLHAARAFFEARSGRIGQGKDADM